jgi:GNAT superfamily N-acetyltransferase
VLVGARDDDGCHGVVAGHLRVTPVIRVAVTSDIAGMHRVRLAVRENRLTSSVITETHYIPFMEEVGRTWVAVEDGVVLGFAAGNKTTGNIWALFVDPAQEGRGLGFALHAAMVHRAWHPGPALL